MSTSSNRLRASQGGFTLIELLVVVLVIGILASIAIPAFLGQRRKSQDVAAKSLLRSGAVAPESYYTDNGGLFQGLIAGLLNNHEQNVVWQDPASAGWTVAQAIDDEIDVYPLPAAPAVPDSYVLATTSRTGTVFSYVRDANGATYRCSGTSHATATTGCIGTYSGGW